MSVRTTSRGFTFKYLLNIIIRRVWMIIIPLLIIPPIVFIGSKYIDPQYLSETIVSLGGRFQVNRALENMLGFDPNLIGRGFDRRAEIRSIYREVTSTPYLEQLGRLLNFEQDPEIQKQAALLKAHRPRMSDEEALSKVVTASLKDNISVRWAGEDQVGIRAFHQDPGVAQRMSKYLTDIFIREQVRSKVGAMRFTEDFSWEQLDKYEKALQEKLNEKTALESEFARIQIDSVIEVPENRRKLTYDIETARAEIASLENEIAGLNDKLQGISDDYLNLNQSPEIVENLTEIDRTYSSYLDLILQHPWDSYQVFRVKNRAVELLDKIQETINRLVDTKHGNLDRQTRDNLKEHLRLQAGLKAERLSLQYLTRAENRLIDRLTILPGYQAKYEHLEREIAAARELRDHFRQQQESNLITQAILRESEYKIVQEAEIPLDPIKPDKQLLFILSFVLALLIGGATITLAEIYSGAFRKADEIEKELGLPIIGIVPSIKSVKKIEAVSN